MKKYVVIAGVNGAGKSTLYQMYEEFKDMPRINVDEIVRDIGNWKNPRDVFAAGKVAVKNINKYLEEGITFNQETTLCGNSEQFRRFAIYKAGNLVRLSQNVPKWFSKIDG